MTSTRVPSPRSNVGGLRRRLGNRQIQLVAIGGSMGTGLFIAIGTGLYKGGPGSLLLAFFIESLMLGMLNNCLAEMTTYMPVSSGFIRLAGYWVDEAWGFMVGWNLFIYRALTVPFEISAVNVLLEYWVLNLLAIGTYGEAEFWVSSGKIIFIFAYFYSYSLPWPGVIQRAMRMVSATGGTLVHSPSMAPSETLVDSKDSFSTGAAEAKHPRIYIKNAFKTVYWRFGVFFVVGALCVGILVGYNDPTLVTALESGESSAAALSYIIAMKNLGVDVLPHIVSAVMVTTVFSAGNTYTYAATRALHGMAVER